MTGDRTKVTILDMEDRDGAVLGSISDLSIVTDGAGNFILSGIQAGPGSGIAGIEVQEDDVTVETDVTILNFEGDPVSVIADGGGKVTVSISGIATASGIALEWLSLTRVGNLSGLGTGEDIIMNVSRGNIPYNTTTGVASLKAGKLYKLFGTFANFSIDNSDTVDIQWVNSSDNLPLVVGHGTRLRAMASNSDGNNQQTIELIFDPSVDTDVKLHVIEYEGTPPPGPDTFTMYPGWSMATIIEIR